MKEKQQENKDSAAKPKINMVLVWILAILLVGGAVGGFLYWEYLQTRVYVEKSEIYAPIISLSPSATGVLDRVMVEEGDYVKENMVVAYINGAPLKAKSDGLVVSVEDTPGQTVTYLDKIVQMIDPSQLRVIGHVEEDKGLSDIIPGQKVIFTVDAFGSKKFEGTVDMVVPTSRQQDIVFTVSDKREEKQFDVKVKYDYEKYPELKNGMSAKMWILK